MFLLPSTVMIKKKSQQGFDKGNMFRKNYLLFFSPRQCFSDTPPDTRICPAVRHHWWWTVGTISAITFNIPATLLFEFLHVYTVCTIVFSYIQCETDEWISYVQNFKHTHCKLIKTQPKKIVFIHMIFLLRMLAVGQFWIKSKYIVISNNKECDGNLGARYFKPYFKFISVDV